MFLSRVYWYLSPWVDNGQGIRFTTFSADRSYPVDKLPEIITKLVSTVRKGASFWVGVVIVITPFSLVKP